MEGLKQYFGINIADYPEFEKVHENIRSYSTKHQEVAGDQAKDRELTSCNFLTKQFKMIFK